MTVEIRPIRDFRAEWALYRPLIAEFERHHQQIVGLPLHPDSEERHLKRMTGQDIENNLVLLAFRDGRPFATGSARVAESGWSGQERMGRLGDFFVLPNERGSTVVLQMHRKMESWLREQGVSVAQRDTLVANDRAIKLWQHLGYQPVETKLQLVLPGPDLPDSAGIDVRRITDVDAEWPVIEPFLARRDEARSQLTGFTLPADCSQWRREAILKQAERRLYVLVASTSGRDVGLAIVKVSRNPWIFEQIKAVALNVEVVPGEDPAPVVAALMRRAYERIARKDATAVQRELLVSEHDEVALWQQLGYRPFITTLRKTLSP